MKFVDYFLPKTQPNEANTGSSIMDYFWLCLAAFLAGFVDSVVGGGGLVQLPALLLCLPQVPIVTCFGINKCSSIFGTALASYRYARAVKVDWGVSGRAMLTAFIFSYCGARSLHLLDKELIKPLVVGLLVLALVYTSIRKDFGSMQKPQRTKRARYFFAYVVGMLLGFYDGFFGPGTGSFLILAFVGILGYDFLQASAAAKFINLATNLAAVLYFAWTKSILYEYALPMAACNMLGAQFGAKMAIFKGSQFVRAFFLVVVTLLILKLTFEM